ncbi:MAG: phage major capsid protein [Gammaproteobacteria bacterium PRO9]|nr:phage major capsid protein [Gammaproteobacteria bacterium PRO9]
MAFTTQELANIATAHLDAYIKGPAMAQTLQDRPLYDAMRKAQKTFPGGKGEIKKNVKGVYTTTVEGYTHDDTVSYGTPANLKQVSYAWKEHHGGIKMTLTELKIDNISVVDSLNSAEVTEHSEGEINTITSLLADKLDDMGEGWARSFNTLLHGDGVAQTDALAGLKFFLPDSPLTGVVGGLDRATVTYFRHRARTAAYATAAADATVGAINTSTAELPLVISKEMRQLRRFGGRPNLLLCGSDFLEALEAQLYAKGQFTQQGWAAGKNDVGIADITYKGNKFIYDPTMDENGNAKRLYILDTKHLFPYVMEGEDMKQHAPARPATQYVMYRAVTWTGMLFMDQANCHGVYDIA